MTSTGFDPEPRWHWPQDIPSEPLPTATNPAHHDVPGAFNEAESPCPRQGHTASKPQPPSQRDRHWPPRQCRICLETVLPTFHPPSENIPNILQGGPSVTYQSSDPDVGRLLRPCKCKGSSKYVHEGCLQQWRHADPSYGRRNFWQCPTCGFQYRLERMLWGRWISSVTTQITLTVAILVLTVFAAGFIGDVIINFYLDPYWFISTRPLAEFGAKLEPIMHDEDVDASWTEHFLKGFASVGLLGFAKVLFTSPWHWWNLRGSSVGGGIRRAGASGRDRMAGINWLVVVIGVSTFLWVGYPVENGRRIRQADQHSRLSIKASGPGLGELWKRLANESWTKDLRTTTTMTTRTLIQHGKGNAMYPYSPHRHISLRLRRYPFSLPLVNLLAMAPAYTPAWPVERTHHLSCHIFLSVACQSVSMRKYISC